MTQPRKEFNLPPPLMLLKLPYEREVSNAEMETTTPIVGLISLKAGEQGEEREVVFSI